MLDQTFSETNLLRVITINDIIKYRLGKKDEIIKACEEASVKINKVDYTISNLKVTKSDYSDIYKVVDVTDYLALKKLNKNILRLYKPKQSNRHLIVGQIKVLLNETTPMSIIRLDIKKFYENIDRTSILKKINDDHLLSFKSKTLLKGVFAVPQLISKPGLPRGLNISSALSEIYMRKVDEKVRQLKGVYYYGRYVDDIVIFCHCDPHEITSAIKNILLENTTLELNENKTDIIIRKKCSCPKDCRCKTEKLLSFEYLGYKFSFSDVAGNNKNLKISLANSKIKKIKSRIVKAFLDHFRKNDFDLLTKRIEILSSNYAIRSDDESNMYSGIYYNYPLITDFECLEDLTKFLRNIVRARNGAFGKKVQANLKASEKRRIMKFDFLAGFKFRIKSKVDINDLKVLRKCWNHG